MGLSNFNVFNAFVFALIFFMMFEGINLVNVEVFPEGVKPLWVIVLLGIFFGAVAGFDENVRSLRG
jgi:hypothetical protein